MAMRSKVVSQIYLDALVPFDASSTREPIINKFMGKVEEDHMTHKKLEGFGKTTVNLMCVFRRKYDFTDVLDPITTSKQIK